MSKIINDLWCLQCYEMMRWNGLKIRMCVFSAVLFPKPHPRHFCLRSSSLSLVVIGSVRSCGSLRELFFNRSICSSSRICYEILIFIVLIVLIFGFNDLLSHRLYEISFVFFTIISGYDVFFAYCSV